MITKGNKAYTRQRFCDALIFPGSGIRVKIARVKPISICRKLCSLKFNHDKLEFYNCIYHKIQKKGGRTNETFL